jgi:hypothetical protein
MVKRVPLLDRFGELVNGRWADSLGNSVTVTFSTDNDDELTAVLTASANQ